MTGVQLTGFSLTGLALLYNFFVTAVLHVVLNVFTWLFLLGSVGSLLVILISFFEDLNELIGKE